MSLNSCDNIIILNGSEHGLHTTWATYGNVVMFTKNPLSIAPSLRPCLPARLLTCLPAGWPTDPPIDPPIDLSLVPRRPSLEGSTSGIFRVLKLFRRTAACAPIRLQNSAT